MNLRDIEYILAAVDSGSFARAAEICHVSQPSLSIQIKKVERELGHPIFIRDQRGVRLSPYGLKILRHLETIMQEVDQIRHAAEPPDTPDVTPVRIGAIATVAPYIFPILMNVEGVDLEESTTEELLRSLMDERIDAAILALPVKVSVLSAARLFTEPFYLACARDNPVVERMNLDKLTPPEESRFLILSAEHCMSEQTINLCQLNPNRLNRVVRATSLETIRLMVATSADITLMPALARRDNDGLDYHPLPKRFSREIGLVYKSRTARIEPLQSIAQQIRQADAVRQLADLVPAEG